MLRIIEAFELDGKTVNVGDTLQYVKHSDRKKSKQQTGIVWKNQDGVEFEAHGGELMDRYREEKFLIVSSDGAEEFKLTDLVKQRDK